MNDLPRPNVPLAVAPPPASARIPSPPVGFAPVKGGLAVGARPWKAELVAMADAVAELRRFADWRATLGKAAPDQAEAAAVLDSAAQWSAMRQALHAWAQYVSNEEGMAWTGARALMAIVKPLLTAAVAADPSLATSYPKLCALFDARSQITRKGVATKRRRAAAASSPGA